MTKIDFKFDEYQKVTTPLCDSCIVTMQAVQHGVIQYWVTNNVGGVANDWWPESQLHAI